MDIVVPLATFEIHTVGDAAALWLLLDIIWLLVIIELEAEGNLVDSDSISSGVVLQVASEEGLWEEESGYPVDDWGTTGDPLVQEIDSSVAIVDPGSKWLQRQETFLLP